MAYIGQRAAGTTAQSRTMDTMTGDGSTNTLTLSQTPDSAMDVAVYYDGVMQRPGVEYTLSGNTITFTTAPESGVVVYAMTGGAEDIGSPMAGSVTPEMIIDGAVTNAHIQSMSSNKLTGALPALDGSNLTGLPSTIDTKSANDPAIDTNPSAVGHLWANTTSGEMFVCTDNTAGANVWYNIGGGSGDVEPYQIGGGIAGFVSGGYNPPASNVIDQFSYTSNTTGTDHGDLTVGVNNGAGAQSSTHGYHFGGSAGPPSNMFNKYSFSSAGNATSIGTIDTTRSSVAGYSSATHGFYSGGNTFDGAVKKFSFSNESSISAHGSLQDGRYGNASTFSETHGFKMGGIISSSPVNTIDKFAFASNTTAADHGDLRASRNNNTGHSDMINGYSAGGTSPSSSTIDKFSFASNTTASGHGDLSATRSGGAGLTYKNTDGYFAGGNSGGYTAAIDKFSFASNTTASGHGNLSNARGEGPWGNNY